MDPITAGVITTIGLPIIKNIFGGGGSSGPSQAEIMAMLEAQRRREEAERRTWLIGGGIAVVGLLAFVLISRK